MTIHIAIMRCVKPGREAEFEQGLRDFFQNSFSQRGVQGVHMLTPTPGGNTREYGILRSFASAAERDAFYESDEFRTWDERARELTEGDAEYRELHGLEAWFRAPGKSVPPRWKMAVATLVGVYPTSLVLGQTVAPLASKLPMAVQALVIASSMVTLLTWVVMPFVARILRRWLHG